MPIPMPTPCSEGGCVGEFRARWGRTELRRSSARVTQIGGGVCSVHPPYRQGLHPWLLSTAPPGLLAEVL